MIYTTCRYAPVELFAGFQEEVRRLDPSPLNFDCADGCAHQNLCGFAKAVIEEVKAKQITRLVLTDCCDSTRRIYDVLKADPQLEFIYLLPLPHKKGEAEIRLLASSLQDLVQAYEAFSGRTFDPDATLAAYRRQKEKPPVLPEQDYICLTGAHGGQQLVRQIEKTFGQVPIVNQTCTGTRWLNGEEQGDFYVWYAQALLNQPLPCMRMWYHSPRQITQNGHLKGVIFHTIKFCDFYGFEYLMEKKNAGVPVLKIETDTTPSSSGQMKTRLEAFREELYPMEEHADMVTDENVYTAGIDSGSASTDAVIMNGSRKILGRAIIPTGSGAAGTARKALSLALQDAGLQESDLAAIVTTGYGRETTGVTGQSVTEITCHARGAHYLDPDARTVIDIGGQDSKVICIDEKGSVLNFIMNDKCAAGTGRFLEMQARALGLDMETMSKKGLEWQNDLTITSMCTVFAESEVVGLVAQNTPTADIIHGLNKAVAAKTASLAARLDCQPVYLMTGGVARNQGVVQCLQEKLNSPLHTSPDSQLCGSIGAALIALEQLGSQN